MEKLPSKEISPELEEILGEYGHVSVLNHQRQPMPLRQAVADCPPLIPILIQARLEGKLAAVITSLM